MPSAKRSPSTPKSKSPTSSRKRSSSVHSKKTVGGSASKNVHFCRIFFHDHMNILYIVLSRLITFAIYSTLFDSKGRMRITENQFETIGILCVIPSLCFFAHRVIENVLDTKFVDRRVALSRVNMLWLSLSFITITWLLDVMILLKVEEKFLTFRKQTSIEYFKSCGVRYLAFIPMLQLVSSGL